MSIAKKRRIVSSLMKRLKHYKAEMYLYHCGYRDIPCKRFNKLVKRLLEMGAR